MRQSRSPVHCALEVPTTLVPAAAAPTHIHSTAGDSAPATAGASQREVVCRGGRRRLSLSTRVKSWHSSAAEL
jgi:hypothetical protein